MQILKFKMSKTGTSKQVERKDLLLADKVLVIDKLDKKTLQNAIVKKLESQV